MAADLVKEGVNAICAVAPLAVRAAHEITRSVPIIALDLESDPVANGWATSLAHPGGNITGIFLDLPNFTAKSLQLLREVVPGAAKIGVLWHPASGTLQLDAARQAAAARDQAVASRLHLAGKPCGEPLPSGTVITFDFCGTLVQ